MKTCNLVHRQKEVCVRQMTKSTQMCSLKVIFYSLHLIIEFHDSVIKITSYNSCYIVFLCLLHNIHSIFTQNGKCSTNIYSVYSIYSFTYHLSISVILKILPDSNQVFLKNQFIFKNLEFQKRTLNLLKYINLN